MTITIRTTCCIAGGGPAGLMLGLLLARNGIDVTVLEKHKDFLRDFRGDTIHPSTMQTLDELGMLNDFLKLPYQPVSRMTARFGSSLVRLADFSTLHVRAPFIAMIPQWDFLNFIAEHARKFPHFQLLMQSEAEGLLRDGKRICGVHGQSSKGDFAISSRLLVAADGRGSVLRKDAGLALEDHGAPIDVLWFRLSRRPDDTDQVQARFEPGRIFIALNRGDYWQCAFVISKGGDEEIRRAGLDAFSAGLVPLLPFAPSRAEELTSWDQVKLLSVQVNRLKTWWLPGFLCIGDAAHAMSPVGGVGINLAIQDAVAAANILTVPLQSGDPISDEKLAEIQARREWPTRVTQRLQLMMHNTILARTLASRNDLKVPLALKLVTSLPVLKRMPARILGLGVRPEHVKAA